MREIRLTFPKEMISHFGSMECDCMVCKLRKKADAENRAIVTNVNGMSQTKGHPNET